MKHDNKNRLFEIMGKIDPTFKNRTLILENLDVTLNEETRKMYNNLPQKLSEYQ